MLSDIDYSDLFSEIKIVNRSFTKRINSPIETINYIESVHSFMNTCTAYKILSVLQQYL